MPVKRATKIKADWLGALVAAINNEHWNVHMFIGIISIWLQVKWDKFVAAVEAEFGGKTTPEGQPLYQRVWHMPGDMVWVPPGWVHAVRNLQVSRKGGLLTSTQLRPSNCGLCPHATQS